MRKFRTFKNSTEINLTLRFPVNERGDEYQPADYAIVGLPGNSELPLNQVFTGVFKEDWMAYWDSGETDQNPEVYLKEYTNNYMFTFSTGKAFWVINKGDVSINRDDLGEVPLYEQAEALIPTHVGYNLITCPFEFPVDWDLVKELNGIPQSNLLHQYLSDQNRFTTSNTLAPGQGYYFINTTNVSPLRIPYNPIVGIKKPQAVESFDWQIKVNLQSRYSGDATCRLGVHPDAEQGFDQLEYNKPRIMKGLASAYFERPEWNEDYPIFGSDVRPKVDEVETWPLKVYSPNAEKSELSFVGIEDIPAEVQSCTD